ncbi:MAG TPA: phosphomannomutase/phosphoglucomutase, partial [Marmoricola sp.]|nr:phosphomannomutase/phosphoglucomutase [Marmoricola sp.]
GEINSAVTDQQAVLDQIRNQYGADASVEIDELDGLTVSAPDWWFNVRASNTEPLLRLNAEGRDQDTMERIRDQVLGTIRGEH